MQPMTQPVVDLRGRRFGRPTVATGRAQSSAGWITVRSVDARQSGRNSSTIVDGQPMARLVVGRRFGRPISATLKKSSCLPTAIREAAACNSSGGPLAALRSVKGKAAHEATPAKNAPPAKKTAAAAPVISAARPGSKKAQVVAMLQRKNGATLAENIRV